MSGTHAKPRRRQGPKAQRSYATVSGLPPATVSGERRNLRCFAQVSAENLCCFATAKSYRSEGHEGQI